MDVEVHNQAELDAAIAAGNRALCVSGKFYLVTRAMECPDIAVYAGASFSVEAWGSSQPRVEAWESSQPRVEAWGSSRPRVEAWGSSQPRVVAWGSSQPRVVAWESSQPRVVAWESSQPRVEAWGSSQPRVEAWESSQPRVVAWGWVMLSIFGHVIAKLSATVSVHIHDRGGKVDGGKQTVCTPAANAQEWCEQYGAAIVDGVATLYKAVDDDFKSGRGFSYAPGSTPEAPDWDGGQEECGGGLHFVAHPLMGLRYFSDATKFVACPVRVEDIMVHENAEYPDKVKAPRCCAPVWECDRDGERIDQSKETIHTA